MRNPLCLAPTTLFLIGVAAAADPPLAKDGLWSVHSIATQNPGGRTVESTVSLCRSHAHDLRVQEEAKGKGTCKIISTRSAGETKEIETECTIASLTTRIKETVTTTGEDSAHTITQSRFSPAMGGTSEMILTADMKYAGACPAGVEPGDAIMPDGKVVKAPNP
jgi:hypothetical protein